MAIIVQREPTGISREIMSSPFENEKALEDILVAHPNLLQGGVGQDELFFVARQVQLPDVGTIDIFLVTSEGLPVITEVKLSKNQQARREIVAQIFDYVSALTLLDLYQLDDLVGDKLQETIEMISAESQSQDLWKDFNGHLKSARTRFILAIDEAPEGLFRIMEFLRRHTNLDIRLIEIRKFKDGSGGSTFVPIVKVERGATELVSAPGVPSEVVADPNNIAFYENMQKAIPGLKPRTDSYRFAYFSLQNRCEVRYDILLNESVLRISFKSWVRPPDKVKEMVKQLYPNWDHQVSDYALAILPGKGNIMSYCVNIALNAPSVLGRGEFVAEAVKIFKLLVDRFSTVAAAL